MTLLVVPAIFVGQTFGGPLGAAPLQQSFPMILVIAVYALFVAAPVRDVVQGWLGMIAGRVPAAYDDRAVNVARGGMALAMTIAAIVLLVVTFGVRGAGETASQYAFTFVFALTSVIVFGAGRAIPRLWFAVRNPIVTRDDHELPQLLAETGRRARTYFYGAFLSVPLAMGLASSAVILRDGPLPPPPEVRETHAAFEHAQLMFWGRLCRTASKDCPATRRIAAHAPDSRVLHVRVRIDGDGPLCAISADGNWLPRQAGSAAKPVTVEHHPAALGLDVTLPDGADTCTYFVDLDDEGTR